MPSVSTNSQKSDAHSPSSAESTSAGSLLVFFLLAYALMWVCFFTVALAHIPAHSPLGVSLLLLGAFAPAVAALSLTVRAEGGTGVSALLSRVVQWQVPARWYVFALSYTVAVKLMVALTYRLITGVWPRFSSDPWYGIIAAILFSTPFQAGEEIGWRGYALPRLASRFGLAPASVLLGLIWGFWHLPQFFIAEGDTYGQSFFLFVAEVTAMSVAMAWLWAHTRRSLLLPMLLHAAINNSKDIVPSAVPGARNTFTMHGSLVLRITVLLLWVCATYFLARMPKIESVPETPP
jgi:membrane protease YdiL (CAAX protease family)